MNTFRYSLISLLLTIAVFSAVTYTACKRDYCKKVVCVNGGSCLNAKCTCPPGYTGTNCETNLCAGINCLNGGMCINGTCNCPAGFEGVNCEVVNKFIGQYLATDTCNTGSPKIYATSISMKGTGEPVLKITKFGNYNTTAYASIEASANSFYMQGTTYEGFTIIGTGFYNNGNINIGYTISHGGNDFQCSGVWVKQ